MNVPFYLVIGLDPEPHNMPRRNELRTDHRTYVLARDSLIKFAGAMTDDSNNQTGSIYIFEASCERVVRDWISHEPFFKWDVYDQIIVKQVNPALNRIPLIEWELSH
ncbi:hypothetical protein FV139_03000 [Parahaliea maris]|uniref:YCII-related domain-containing protein n=1 Tax=Parahaliea maris TaxID=2716870 RepID=A0A5C9A713_9GAMM|nr:hypothetical protein FV139_03000 [Parahaliea maris]